MARGSPSSDEDWMTCDFLCLLKGASASDVSESGGGVGSFGLESTRCFFFGGPSTCVAFFFFDLGTGARGFLLVSRTRGRSLSLASDASVGTTYCLSVYIEEQQRRSLRKEHSHFLQNWVRHSCGVSCYHSYLPVRQVLFHSKRTVE